VRTFLYIGYLHNKFLNQMYNQFYDKLLRKPESEEIYGGNQEPFF
jgi:hypothetical protein